MSEFHMIIWNTLASTARCITIAEQVEKLLSDMPRPSAIFKWSRWRSSGTTTLDYKTLYNGNYISPVFSYEGGHHPQ
jgi:hypothetical protein